MKIERCPHDKLFCSKHLGAPGSEVVRVSMLIEVWGSYACFSRPEMKTERVSYDVITPSAARGLIEAIYWHPGLRYTIDRIYVLSPIRFTNVRRNEVSSVLSASSAFSAAVSGKVPPVIYASRDIQQRAAMILQDVHYVIDCHFDLTGSASPGDNAGKFQDILRRRLARGQCYHTPYFGCREFPAAFREWPGGPIPALDLTQELGWMLYDMDYSDPGDIRAQFFRARLDRGVVDCRRPEVVT